MVEITVRGSHSVDASPERATVQIQVHLEGPDMKPIHDGVVDVSAAIRQTIEPLHDAAAGPITRWSSAQLRTWTQRPWNQEGEPRPLVHHAQVDVTAEFADFARLSSWLTSVLLLRGVSVAGIDWSLTPEHRRRLLGTARAEAVADARDKAQAYATALGLGAVRPVAIADAGMLGQHGEQPVHRGGAMFAAKMGGGDVELAPRDIDVTVDVDARFLAD